MGEIKFNDLKNKRFGEWTVVQRVAGQRPRTGVFYECRCSCGHIAIVRAATLQNGTTKSCGCLKRSNCGGKRFGLLTAVERVKGGRWRCVCDCGKEKLARTNELTKGALKSCGCLGRVKKAEDLTSQVFGEWVVLRKAPSVRRTAFLSVGAPVDSLKI